MTPSTLEIPSLKGKVSDEEWAVRVDLAAAYRLVSRYGWEDLVFTAGDALYHSPGVPRTQQAVLFHNLGNGKFKDISPQGGPYFRTRHVGRGAVLADFDNDGRVDLAVSHLDEPVVLLHNEADTAGRHWLGVALEGAGHRDVVGAHRHVFRHAGAGPVVPHRVGDHEVRIDRAAEARPRVHRIDMVRRAPGNRGERGGAVRGRPEGRRHGGPPRGGRRAPQDRG